MDLTMQALQEQFDDAAYEFSIGNIDAAIARFRAILTQDPRHLEAMLALSNAFYAKGDYPTAIAEGHNAEKLNPRDPFVHMNLSRAYLRFGDKAKAEFHATQSKLASWRADMKPPGPKSQSELEMSKPETGPTPKV